MLRPLSVPGGGSGVSSPPFSLLSLSKAPVIQFRSLIFSLPVYGSGFWDTSTLFSIPFY